MKVKGLNVDGVIKIDNARVYGLDESILASGYPMMVDTVDMDTTPVTMDDEKRAKVLGSCKAGTGHDCFSKGIIIQFDMQVPEYIWRQWDRYHFNDYVSSQSKMHRILKLDINETCNKYVHKENIKILNDMIDTYNNFEEFKKEALEINENNRIELRSGEKIEISKENIFNMIIANCPCGLMLGARVTLNYLQAKSIKAQRKHHKMQEWHYICDFLDSLPMFNEITEK